MSAQDSKARGLHASAAQPGDAADRLRRPLIEQSFGFRWAQNDTAARQSSGHGLA